ncbi:hypothetical protein [Streptomyces sp. IB201691-2A2]|uniref:hypothetical protein n=1 Tax=Streptomyces sp. IB201691-2A2 TaxID=2561920 RepID=UPI00163D592E|nr:hypothetical protein [Streptomyces sp. IB201691-2A2]
MVNSQSPQQPLLGLRTAIILLLGALTALGAGILTGGAAFAAAVLFFHTVIA